MLKRPTTLDNEEKFRAFIIRRSWLHGKGRLVSDADYISIKARDGKFWQRLSGDYKCYLMGFVDGWKQART